MSSKYRNFKIYQPIPHKIKQDNTRKLQKILSNKLKILNENMLNLKKIKNKSAFLKIKEFFIISKEKRKNKQIKKINKMLEILNLRLQFILKLSAFLSLKMFCESSYFSENENLHPEFLQQHRKKILTNHIKEIVKNTEKFTNYYKRNLFEIDLQKYNKLNRILIRQNFVQKDLFNCFKKWKMGYFQKNLYNLNQKHKICQIFLINFSFEVFKNKYKNVIKSAFRKIKKTNKNKIKSSEKINSFILGLEKIDIFFKRKFIKNHICLSYLQNIKNFIIKMEKIIYFDQFLKAICLFLLKNIKRNISFENKIRSFSLLKCVLDKRIKIILFDSFYEILIQSNLKFIPIFIQKTNKNNYLLKCKIFEKKINSIFERNFAICNNFFKKIKHFQIENIENYQENREIYLKFYELIDTFLNKNRILNINYAFFKLKIKKKVKSYILFNKIVILFQKQKFYSFYKIIQKINYFEKDNLEEINRSHVINDNEEIDIAIIENQILVNYQLEKKFLKTSTKLFSLHRNNILLNILFKKEKLINNDKNLFFTKFVNNISFEGKRLNEFKQYLQIQEEEKSILENEIQQINLDNISENMSQHFSEHIENLSENLSENYEFDINEKEIIEEMEIEKSKTTLMKNSRNSRYLENSKYLENSIYSNFRKTNEYTFTEKQEDDVQNEEFEENEELNAALKYLEFIEKQNAELKEIIEKNQENIQNEEEMFETELSVLDLKINKLKETTGIFQKKKNEKKARKSKI